MHLECPYTGMETLQIEQRVMVDQINIQIPQERR
jgi:hypothetical protein